MTEIPFGTLEYENDAIIGVRCPECQMLIAQTDPMEAARVYALHFHQVHGVPS